MAEGVLTDLITHLLKVPPQPEPPAGSPGSVEVFNAAPGYYSYRRVKWLLKQLGTGIGILVGLFVVMAEVDFARLPFGDGLWKLIETLAIIGFLIQIPFTYLMVRLDYRYRWYMTTDTSLRIREGITTVRERTMTFANIQNLSLKQGPVQRLFGVSDLQVRTAGGGGAEASSDAKKGLADANNMHLGYFRGVDNAEEIRNLILGRMKGMRDSGLGDPDEPASAAPATIDDAQDELAAAAAELLAEARSLRAAMGA
jgi:membrane protein YdbS with pleckstrin-like domain